MQSKLLPLFGFLFGCFQHFLLHLRWVLPAFFRWWLSDIPGWLRVRFPHGPSKHHAPCTRAAHLGHLFSRRDGDCCLCWSWSLWTRRGKDLASESLRLHPTTRAGCIWCQPSADISKHVAGSVTVTCLISMRLRELEAIHVS